MYSRPILVLSFESATFSNPQNLILHKNVPESVLIYFVLGDPTTSSSNEGVILPVPDPSSRKRVIIVKGSALSPSTFNIVTDTPMTGSDTPSRYGQT